MTCPVPSLSVEINPKLYNSGQVVGGGKLTIETEVREKYAKIPTTKTPYVAVDPSWRDFVRYSISGYLFIHHVHFAE